ncbi:ribonucleotide-diphosphate reductase subunit beta [Mycoplasma sp. SG1]|uniref:ribonucleotide-diphosphate reductase subunit beta n=1 Tax=Mycoplasma sp. SG1 TaxID=2810348 RepID=UPI002024BACA|nr:ribonucleotide-diphosphate reductase subunit beta [Mycoplasma sp. SG1]URM53154.1 ribonucleotide-diphosphate reductase subunit beta [Mycoplasma sp. SG1]
METKKNKSSIINAVNWNIEYDNFTHKFYQQNISQMWTPDEIPVSKDIKCWKITLTEEEKEVYKKVLVFLTVLDTQQGCNNLPSLILNIDNLQQKAVLGFMDMMEHIHAKSYSTIFMTILSNKEINELFDYADKERLIQEKAATIDKYFISIVNKNAPKKDVYLAMVASCMLEYFLFYTGFFYPLYLAGHGKMVASGEIIFLIIRDEILHGAFVGLLAKNLYKTLSESDKEYVDKEFQNITNTLVALETEWTKKLFTKLGLVDKVLAFMKHNLNRIYKIFEKPQPYENQVIDPIVEKYMKNITIQHDFFSTKGNTYFKSTTPVELDDDETFEL